MLSKMIDNIIDWLKLKPEDRINHCPMHISCNICEEYFPRIWMTTYCPCAMYSMEDIEEIAKDIIYDLKKEIKSRNHE